MKNLFGIFILYSCSLSGQIPLIPTNTSNNLLTISIFSNNIVVAGRDNYLVKSYDECETLTPLTVPEPIGFQNYFCRADTEYAYMLSTSQPQNIYRIYKSNDGGYNWTKKLDTFNLFLSKLKFFDKDNGIVAAAYNIIRTANGANTWTGSASPIIQPTALEVFADSIAVLGGSSSGGGDVFISKNMGKTWTLGDVISNIPRGFCVLSKDTVLVTAFQPNLPSFAKSVSGGTAMVETSLPNMKEVYGVNFRKHSEGYVLGRKIDNNGIILKTTNFGQNWTEYNTQINCCLMDMKFINDSIALVSGTNGVLFKWNARTGVFVSIRESLENLQKVRIFPNPVQDNILIDIQDISLNKLSIVNALGKIVFMETNPKQEIDISFLESGVYLLKLENEAGLRAYKIIKE